MAVLYLFCGLGLFICGALHDDVENEPKPESIVKVLGKEKP